MATPTRVAVVLSGCGVFDGAEIHESVLTLLALNRRGVEYQCFAPDVPQRHVVNHITGAEMDETRNVMVEAARIARGAILPLADYNPAEFDAIMFPGGFGAAKNLCSFAFDGPNCTVEPSTERAILATKAAGKPIGALCISPALMVKVLGNVSVTIGSDPGTAEAIEAMGGDHMETTHGGVVVDREARLATTPCYMLEATVSQIADGADNVVAAVLEMAGKTPRQEVEEDANDIAAAALVSALGRQ